MEKGTFVIERLINAGPETIWKALTDKDQMKQWYFDLDAFEAKPGFEFSFIGRGKDGTKEFIHLCRVMEVEVNKKLSYTWRYKDFQGDSLVSFELFPEGERTRVKLTHQGLDTFPAMEDFAAENFKEGWTMLIGTLLPGFVKKES